MYDHSAFFNDVFFFFGFQQGKSTSRVAVAGWVVGLCRDTQRHDSQWRERGEQASRRAPASIVRDARSLCGRGQKGRERWRGDGEHDVYLDRAAEGTFVCEIWCGRKAARGERGGAASSVGVEETQSLVPAAIAKLGSISSLSLGRAAVGEFGGHDSLCV